MSGVEPRCEVLSVGMIVGGRTTENGAWVDAIASLRKQITAVRSGLQSDLNLNVEFQISGNHLQPDFEGVRTGAFRKADSLLKVQVAVRAHPPTDPRAEVMGLLVAAVQAADGWVAAKQRGFDMAPLHGLVASVQRAWSHED